MSSALESSVHLGDCLPLLREIPDEAFDAVYLDPPFFTQRTHCLQPRDRSKVFSFDDIWSNQGEYVSFLVLRLRELRRVMSKTASLFFHCDRNAVHLIRTLLDEVFDADHFRAEIIWHYRRWSNSAKGLLPAHQTILYYTKTDHFTFNQIFDEYSPSTNVDQLLQRRSRDAANKSVYERDESGNVVPHGAKRGVPLSDVWDIPSLNPKARERTGYPTQKPLLLLERILSLSTNEGDRVLDPFCGSGTTLVAAQSMGRSAVGIDVSEDAVNLSKARIAFSERTHSRLHELGRESYRTADDKALQHLIGLECVPVHRNSGIDAILKAEVMGRPVTIRIQKPSESVQEAAQSLYQASQSKGASIMFLIVSVRGGSFEFADVLPAGVVLIESAALRIREFIEKLDTQDFVQTVGCLSAQQ